MTSRPRPRRNPSAGITAPQGFTAAGGTCGIKASGLPDLTLIAADQGCAAAGVFTTSRTPSAPVLVCRRHLQRAQKTGIRAILCNSGNANASTGKPGEHDALAMCRLTGQGLGVSAHQVLVCSTGVIGRPLPMDKIGRGIATLLGRRQRGPAADAAAARGILTTDLTPKSAVRRLTLGGKRVTLAGICKGSGMIAPNMATMLAFVTTDAAIAPRLLRRALQLATAASFNRISVDQHTSPSDTLLALASGAAGNTPISKTTSDDFTRFTAALTDLCRDLAYQIIKDGEGATKVFRVQVTHARHEREADQVAKAIVDSPLVKTAIHGGDPNWGRITTAAGYSGAAVDPRKMTLTLSRSDGKGGVITVYDQGGPTTLTKAEQRRLVSVMRGKEIVVNLSLGRGGAAVEWLGCDLSRQYIAINADYTT
jgi:glutamate N-acetyltransferase/amino-acid N-acetyltransferase